MSYWHKGITKYTAIYESGLSDRIKEFRKVRRLRERKHQLNPALGYLFYDCSKLVTFYEMVEVSFHFIGTTAAGSRCLQNVIRKFHLRVWQTTSKIAPKSVPTCSTIIFPHSTNHIIDSWLSRCRRRFLNSASQIWNVAPVNKGQSEVLRLSLPL